MNPPSAGGPAPPNRPDGAQPGPVRSGAASPLFHWLATHVRSLHAALGIYLVAGFAALLAACALFAWMADEVGEGSTQRFDTAVLSWFHDHSSPLLDRLALEVTPLGSGGVVVMMVLMSTAFLWVSRHRFSVLLLWVAVLGGEVLNWTLKSAFDRPRPSVFTWKTTASTSSFPSGHAMTSVIVYVTLAYLIARLETGRGMRRMTLGMAALLVLGIGWSRMYLGVHYPSDVLAGYAAGFAWSTFCALGIETVRHFRHRDPAAHEERHLDQPLPPVEGTV
jgi:undecaprenyl-diphosphatase